MFIGQRTQFPARHLGLPETEIDVLVEKFVEDQCASLTALMISHDKPVLGFSFLTRENPFILELQDNGVSMLLSPERATRVLGALVEYKHLKGKDCPLKRL